MEHCYKHIFWFLFDLMVTNRYILCRNYTDLPIKTVKDFRVTLAKQLIGDYASRKRPGRRPNTPAAWRFCQSHFSVRGADKGHHCHHCYHKKERHQCGCAENAMSFYVTMVEKMTVFVSTTYAMAPLMTTKDSHYKIHFTSSR